MCSLHSVWQLLLQSNLKSVERSERKGVSVITTPQLMYDRVHFTLAPKTISSLSEFDSLLGVRIEIKKHIFKFSDYKCAPMYYCTYLNYRKKKPIRLDASIVSIVENIMGCKFAIKKHRNLFQTNHCSSQIRGFFCLWPLHDRT